VLAGDALEIARLRDLRVVDGNDEVAGLEAEALRRRSAGDVNDHYALRRGIQPQALRKRRREVGYLGTLERRARSDDKFLERRLGGGLERDIDREFLAGPHDAEPCMTADRLGSEAVVERIAVIDPLPIASADQVPSRRGRPPGRPPAVGAPRAGRSPPARRTGA